MPRVGMRRLEEHLKRCFHACLECARSNEHRSIAFPTDVLLLVPDGKEAARVFCEAMIQWIEGSGEHGNSIRNIFVVSPQESGPGIEMLEYLTTAYQTMMELSEDLCCDGDE